MGAQNVLFGKCASNLMLELFINGNIAFLGMFGTYFTIVMLGLTIFCQLRWLNEALVRFESSYVVPVFEVFWVSLAVVGGLVMYREGSLLTKQSAIMFVVGLAFSLVGMCYFYFYFFIFSFFFW